LLQQQQSGEVLQALQSGKSGQLQAGASQQLSGIMSEDWFETRSMFSEAFSLEQQLSEQLLAAQQQAIMPAPAPALQLQQAGPWVPETPLLFAGETLAGTFHTALCSKQVLYALPYLRVPGIDTLIGSMLPHSCTCSCCHADCVG
jgi:hypothetical protein